MPPSSARAFDFNDPIDVAFAVESAFRFVEGDQAIGLAALLNQWPQWPLQAVKMTRHRGQDTLDTLFSAAIRKAGHTQLFARNQQSGQPAAPAAPTRCVQLLIERWHPLLGPRLHPLGDPLDPTLLMRAAGHGLSATVRLVASKVDMEARDEHGQTALFHALSQAAGRTLQALLDAGANPAATDANGWDALMQAAGRHCARDLRLLIPVSDPHRVDKSGRSALIEAVCAGSADNVDILAPLSDLHARARFQINPEIDPRGEHANMNAMECAALFARHRHGDMQLAWPTFDALAFHAAPEDRVKMIRDAEATPAKAPRAFARMEAGELAAAVSAGGLARPSATEGGSAGRIKRL